MKSVGIAVVLLSTALAAGQRAATSQPAACEACRPEVTQLSAPNRSAPNNYYDQGRDSIAAIYPRHRLLAERRAERFGQLEYSLLAYQSDPSAAVSMSAMAVDWQARRTWGIENSCAHDAWPGGLIETLKTIAGLPGQSGVPADTALIEAVKATVVREIDPQLPTVSFDAWTKGLVGMQARMKWETNDCGEQTGNPALDRGRVFPVCVEVRVELTGNRALILMLSAGSQQKQPAGTPGYHYGVVVQPDGSHVEIRRLTGVAAAIKAVIPRARVGP